MYMGISFPSLINRVLPLSDFVRPSTCSTFTLASSGPCLLNYKHSQEFCVLASPEPVTQREERGKVLNWKLPLKLNYELGAELS